MSAHDRADPIATADGVDSIFRFIVRCTGSVCKHDANIDQSDECVEAEKKRRWESRFRFKKNTNMQSWCGSMGGEGGSEAPQSIPPWRQQILFRLKMRLMCLLVHCITYRSLFQMRVFWWLSPQNLDVNDLIKPSAVVHRTCYVCLLFSCLIISNQTS